MYLSACTHDKNRSYQEAPIYSIDIERDDQVSVLDLFSTVEIIPLETNEHSVMTFLIGEPDKVIKFQGEFYFLDRNQRSIFIFNSQGKFIKKIDKQGAGPGEYISLSDFNINRFTHNLEILSSEGRCILVYNLKEFSFIEKIQFPKELPIVHHFQHINADEYVLYSSAGEAKLFSYFPQNKKYTEMDYGLPKWLVRNTNFTTVSQTPFYVYNNLLCFEQLYNGDVFTIQTNNPALKPRYSWDFGTYNFKLDVLPPDESMNYYINLSRKLSFKYAILFQIYKENNKFYFTRFKFRNRYKHLILNKETSEYLLFDKFLEGGQCLPQWIEEEAIYTFIPPEYLHFVIEDPSFLDPNNQQIYHTILDEDNPVIVKYVFK